MNLYAGGWFSFGPDDTGEFRRLAAALPGPAGPNPSRSRAVSVPGGLLSLPMSAGDASGTVAGVHTGPNGDFLMAMGHFFDLGDGTGPRASDLPVPERLWTAWHQRGEALWEAVDGSFVAAIGHAAARRLILVCDREENHSLYFRTDAAGCFFATELPAILATLPASPELDPDYFIDSLLCTWHHSDLSPVRGVRRVPPGHLAEITPQGVRYRRHWFPERFSPVRFKRSDDYVDAALEQLEAAIRRRLPSSGPVATHCSSGLDSSLVTAVTARLLAAEGREILPLTLVTPPSLISSDGGNAHWDEGPRVRAFVQTLPNARPIAMSLDQPDLYGAIDRFQTAASRPTLGIVNLKPLDLMHQRAVSAGARVVLTGIGGNVTLSAGGDRELPALLARGRLGDFLAGWHGLRREGASRLGLTGAVLSPWLPDAVLSALLRARGRTPGWALETMALRPDLVKERPDAFVAWRRLAPSHRAAPNPRDRQATVLSLGGWQVITQAMRRQHGAYLRHPLADAKLIRFCLGLPPEQTLRRGETRSLARRLARRLGLPPAIADETRRAYTISAWPTMLTESRAEIENDLRRIETDPLASSLIDVPRLRHLLDAVPATEHHKRQNFTPYFGLLFPALSVGRFIAAWRGRND
jgi:asparagine synthase (glutamine-hydrolysing)